MENVPNLQYPIGKFKAPESLTEEQIKQYITSIEKLPALLREAVAGLKNDQLNTPYRPEGWTIRQVIHHVADSHINSYTRFRLALTEDKPIIKPYMEEKWAELEDGKNADIEVSLTLLEAIHKRWVILLKSLSSQDLKRSFIHPASGEITLEKNIGLYAWHGEHHVAHISALRKRMNW